MDTRKKELKIALLAIMVFETLMGLLACWLANDDIKMMLNASFIHQFVKNFGWANVFFIILSFAVVVAIEYNRRQLATPFWKKRG